MAPVGVQHCGLSCRCRGWSMRSWFGKEAVSQAVWLACCVMVAAGSGAAMASGAPGVGSPAGSRVASSAGSQVGSQANSQASSQSGSPTRAAVDANTASLDELRKVRGIGDSLAARIVAERANGPYRNLDDLAARVRGVGDASVRRLAQAGLRVGRPQGAGTAARDKPRAAPPVILDVLDRRAQEAAR
jgi:competence protein ComEA